MWGRQYGTIKSFVYSRPGATTAAGPGADDLPVGLKANLGFQTVNSPDSQNAGLPAAEASGRRSRPSNRSPGSLELIAEARLESKQFEFDASAPYPDVVQTNWNLAPAVSPRSDLHDRLRRLHPCRLLRRQRFNVNVKDKWGRVAFVGGLLVPATGERGAAQDQDVVAVGVVDGILTLTVGGEHDRGELNKVGVIGKRAPASDSVKSSPASATIPAKGTKSFIVTMPVDSQTEPDVVSQALASGVSRR
jgi:hypothetical protein